MDHLPKLQEPCRPHIPIPFLGRVPSEVEGFWDYPSTQGFKTEDLVNDLSTHGPYIGLRILKLSTRDGVIDYSEMASVLQAWWWFGMLNEVLGVSVNPSDFVRVQSSEDPGKTTPQSTITTEKLEKYLCEWRGRLDKLSKEEISRCLSNAMRCITSVHKWVEQLGTRIELHVRKPTQWDPIPAELRKIANCIRVSANGNISVSDEAFSLIRKHYGNGEDKASNPPESSFGARSGVKISVEELKTVDASAWTKFGRKILPEALELSICILGFSLSHAVKSISMKKSIGPPEGARHVGWYCPRFIHYQMISEGSCRRAIHRLDSTFLLIGGYLSSRLQFPGVTEPTHAECTTIECRSDQMVDFTYTRRHQETCQLCFDMSDENVPSSVAAILRNGGIPVLRLSPESSPQELIVEVLATSSERPYVAFSHVWSDGLGNPDDNKLYQCQWKWLQKLADQTQQSDSPTFFWIDTICVPLRNPEKVQAGEHQEQNLRAIAISRMRNTYANAAKVLVLDTYLSFLMSKTSVFEFSLRFSGSKWMRRLWTMHEGAVARPGATCVKLADGVFSLKEVFHHIESKIEEDESESHNSILGSLGLMESMSPWARCLEVRDRGSPQENFFFAWNESKDRGTKYEADRHVVVGSLLNLESQKTLRMSDDEKMKFLFSNTIRIPPGILFMRGPRLQDEGWRWAPSSLSKKGRRIEYIPNVPIGELQERGLKVTFDGWILDCHPEWGRRFQYNGQYTDILPTSDHALGTSTWAVELFPKDDSDQLYSMNLTLKDHAEPQFSPTATLGVILERTFENHKGRTRATLVSIHEADRDDENNVRFARFEYDLDVVRIDASGMKTVRNLIAGGNVQLIRAMRVADGKDQNWCIR